MRFIVDAQLPPGLARKLAEKGYQAEHVVELGLEAAPDRVIWDFAIEIDAVILTKDEDFARRRAMSGAGPTIVWIRLPNTRRQHLLAWFERVLPYVVVALEQGESLIEIG